jgi:hypothetical protein
VFPRGERGEGKEAETGREICANLWDPQDHATFLTREMPRGSGLIGLQATKKKNYEAWRRRYSTL